MMIEVEIEIAIAMAIDVEEGGDLPSVVELVDLVVQSLERTAEIDTLDLDRGLIQRRIMGVDPLDREETVVLGATLSPIVVTGVNPMALNERRGNLTAL